MTGRRRVKEVRGRLTREVTIVETVSVTGEENLRPEWSGETGAGSVLPGTQRTKEFIWQPGRWYVEDHCVPRLGVIEDEVGRSACRVPFIVEVMIIAKEDSLQ